MLYHVSRIHDLKVLKPQPSSHGKPYVYAVDNIVIGLLFGARKDDFDFVLTTDKYNRPIIYECYKNAFETIYKGAACSIYEVDKSGFKKGQTGWDAEYVCENEVEVLKEIVIEDLYARLCDEEKKGNLVIHRYEDTEDYKKFISKHIVDRLIRFGILDRSIIEERLRDHYGRIIDMLYDIMSGKYL